MRWLGTSESRRFLVVFKNSAFYRIRAALPPALLSSNQTKHAHQGGTSHVYRRCDTIAAELAKQQAHGLLHDICQHRKAPRCAILVLCAHPSALARAQAWRPESTTHIPSAHKFLMRHTFPEKLLKVDGSKRFPVITSFALLCSKTSSAAEPLELFSRLHMNEFADTFPQ